MKRRRFASIAMIVLLGACGGGSGNAGRGVAAGGSGGPEAVDGTGGIGGAGGGAGAGGVGGTVDPDAPRIDAVVPASALAGTTVELRGERLHATRELVVLFRPGVSGRVLAAGGGGSWIRTIVPNGATTGPVHVRIDGTDYEGPSFTVESGAPVPTIERLVPEYVLVGDRGTTVRIEGWGFQASSRVLMDGRQFVPASATSSALEVFLPATELATAGRRWFTVENLPPGGGESDPVPFQVSGPFNLLEAVATSNTSVQLAFDQRPSPDASDPRSYLLECSS